MEKVTLGFIGLGAMGRPMALNLLKGGYPLRVHSRSPEPVEALVAAGAAEATSPRTLAAGAAFVLLCLPDSPDVLQVMEGPDGVLAALGPGQVVIDMSTISPVVARELAGRVGALGAAMLDAPVSGGVVGARQGTLSIMVGGEAEVFERARPLFELMGKNIVRIGESGAGQVAKACNQIVVALTIEAISEALVLAAKAGVDPAAVREALLGGFAQSRILDLHGRRLLARDFAPGFRVALQHKDLNIALETGRAYGVPLVGTSLVHELYGALLAAGDGNLDHSALATVVESLAGGAAW